MTLQEIQSTHAGTYYGVENTPKPVEKEKQENKTNDVGVIYEKSEIDQNATYSVQKMTKEERLNLVEQLKTDEANRRQSLIDLVTKTITGQATTSAIANEDDIWKKFANGEVTVDEVTKKQAQEDISEDGYWGVKQTSQRLFDFAQALAGDDVDKMKDMQDAIQKGYKEATKAWGKELPDISKQTLDATNKMFDEYYKQKETITE